MGTPDFLDIFEQAYCTFLEMLRTCNTKIQKI